MISPLKNFAARSRQVFVADAVGRRGNVREHKRFACCSCSITVRFRGVKRKAKIRLSLLDARVRNHLRPFEDVGFDAIV